VCVCVCVCVCVTGDSCLCDLWVVFRRFHDHEYVASAIARKSSLYFDTRRSSGKLIVTIVIYHRANSDNEKECNISTCA